MRNYLQTFDSDIIYLNDDEYAKITAVLDNPTKYPAKMINVRGSRIAISAIKEVKSLEPFTQRNSDLRLSAEELFRLPAGLEKNNFWYQVIQFNRKRRAEKKPWVFAKAIEFTKRATGVDTPVDLFEFIDAEWEHVKEYNTPKNLV